MRKGEIHRIRGKCCPIVTMDTAFPELNPTSSLVVPSQDVNIKPPWDSGTRVSDRGHTGGWMQRHSDEHNHKTDDTSEKPTDDAELGIIGGVCNTKKRRTKSLNKRTHIDLGGQNSCLHEYKRPHEVNEYMIILEKEKLERMQRDLGVTKRLSASRRHQSVSYGRLHTDQSLPPVPGQRSRTYCTSKQSTYRSTDDSNKYSLRNTCLPPMANKFTVRYSVEDENKTTKELKVKHTKKTAQIKKNRQKLKDNTEVDRLVLDTSPRCLIDEMTDSPRCLIGEMTDSPRCLIGEMTERRPTFELQSAVWLQKQSPVQQIHSAIRLTRQSATPFIDTHVDLSAPLSVTQFKSNPRIEAEGLRVKTKIPKPNENTIGVVEKKDFSSYNKNSKIPVPTARGLENRSDISLAGFSNCSARTHLSSDKRCKFHETREAPGMKRPMSIQSDEITMPLSHSGRNFVSPGVIKSKRVVKASSQNQDVWDSTRATRTHSIASARSIKSLKSCRTDSNVSNSSQKSCRTTVSSTRSSQRASARSSAKSTKVSPPVWR